MRIPIVAALAGLAFTAPAHAADLATIDCVIAKLQPALTTLIEADVTRNLNESGKRPTYDPAIGSGLRIAAAACATEHEWSEAAVNAARIYTLAKLGWPIAQRVVAEKGFDAGALEDQFQALPEEARNRPLTTGEAQGLVMAAVTDEARQTRENAELLNEFFLFISTIQSAAYDFFAGLNVRRVWCEPLATAPPPIYVRSNEFRAQLQRKTGTMANQEEITTRVTALVVDHLGVDAKEVTLTASFIDDLGADSLDIVELVMAFEEEFGVEIPDDAAEKITTVGDAVSYISEHKED